MQREPSLGSERHRALAMSVIARPGRLLIAFKPNRSGWERSAA
jgi:hypothetical protein